MKFILRLFGKARGHLAWLILLVAVSGCATHSLAQEIIEPYPEVTSASVPFYPPIAMAARVQGTVTLHITTDEKGIASITKQTGPAMLIKPTEENARTWVFAGSSPSSFDVTYRYKLHDSAGCDIEIQPVILRLPLEVEVNGKLKLCDTGRYFRQQKYLREHHVYPVELHVTMDGESIANPAEVVISDGAKSLTLPVRGDLFLVPEAMASGQNLSMSAIVGSDSIAIAGIAPFALKCIWNLGLANKKSDTDDPAMKGRDVRSMCTISFDPLDGDGMGMVVDPCREPVKK